jgi:hypothetical protein
MIITIRITIKLRVVIIISYIMKIIIKVTRKIISFTNSLGCDDGGPILACKRLRKKMGKIHANKQSSANLE